MKIHELSLTKKPKRKRLGRGIGSGTGKTAGRGTKGQNARTGGGVAVGFEGGQTKLSMRLPKSRGFTARNSVDYQLVHTSDLNKLTKTTLDLTALRELKLIKSTRKPTKLLFDSAVDKKIVLKIQAASKTAIEAVQKAGGSVEIVQLAGKTTNPDKPKTTRSDNKTRKPEDRSSKTTKS